MRRFPIEFPLFTSIALLAGAASGEEVPTQSPTQVEGRCNEQGGTYFPPSAESVTYGCVRQGANGDMTGIVCGGSTLEQKATCDTFRTMPPRLPTRGEIKIADRAAERAWKTGAPRK